MRAEPECENSPVCYTNRILPVLGLRGSLCDAKQGEGDKANVWSRIRPTLTPLHASGLMCFEFERGSNKPGDSAHFPPTSFVIGRQRTRHCKWVWMSAKRMGDDARSCCGKKVARSVSFALGLDDRKMHMKPLGLRRSFSAFEIQVRQWLCSGVEVESMRDGGVYRGVPEMESGQQGFTVTGELYQDRGGLYKQPCVTSTTSRPPSNSHHTVQGKLDVKRQKGVGRFGGIGC